MTRPTSQKLDDLHRALDRAIDANHAHEIRDDIRREEEHLRTCPYAKSERDIDEYDRLLKIAADIIDATAKALGIPKAEEGKASILKAIEDLKTAAGVASHRAAQLTGLAIDRGDAIDRLLTVLKAPLRYDNGEPLTREERVEWAIRRAKP